MENPTTVSEAGASPAGVRLIVTSAEAFLRVALRELRRVDPQTREVERFGNGLFMVEARLPLEQLCIRLRAARSIFIKHVMPITAQVPLSGRGEGDLLSILDAARAACKLEPGARFAVQCRLISSLLCYRAKDVEVAVGSAFEAEGCIPTFSDLSVNGHVTDSIISIFAYRERCFIGCSSAEDNLNEHCDEYRVCSRSRREISRSEFKLEEAIRTFGLRSIRGRALDLGASPGGWTRVLALRGMQVVAVDTADIDERVRSLGRVTVIRARAEHYQPEGLFDLIVNDINRDPEESARIMVYRSASLKPGGTAVMTVKLTGGDPEEKIRRTLAILDAAFVVAGVRHLFHNRREVTICLRRRARVLATPFQPGLQ